jgi:hypothetical protein
MSKPEATSSKAPLAAVTARAVLPVALAAFLAAPVAHADTLDQSKLGQSKLGQSKLGDRIAAAKKQLATSDLKGTTAIRVAQWLNIGGGPPWGNWNNWHNWHNWGNGMWLNL